MLAPFSKRSFTYSLVKSVLKTRLLWSWQILICIHHVISFPVYREWDLHLALRSPTVWVSSLMGFFCTLYLVNAGRQSTLFFILKCQPYCQHWNVKPFLFYCCSGIPQCAHHIFWFSTDIWITHSAFSCLILWLMLQKKILHTVQQFGILRLVIILLICVMSLGLNSRKQYPSKAAACLWQGYIYGFVLWKNNVQQKYFLLLAGA